MKIRLITTLITLLTLLSGCIHNINDQNESPQEHTAPLDLTSISISDETDSVKSLRQQIYFANQLVDELELLIHEFQKQDELVEALEMMEIAKQEVEIIRKNVQSQINQYSDIEVHLLFDTTLTNFVNGVSLQLKGWENGDVEQMTTGYKLMEQSKLEIDEFVKFIDDLE